MPSKPQPRKHSASRADGTRFQESTGGELVKNMSSLPAFLQRADNPQDKVLNFGVLDWESLQKWKHAKKRGGGGDSYAGSISKASCSNVYASERVNSYPEFLPQGPKVLTSTENCIMDAQKRRAGSLMKKSHRAKARDAYQGGCLEMGIGSSKLSAHEKTVEKCNELDSDRPHQRHHRQQDSVILLLPKDFTGSGGLDEFKYASVDGNSAELNWNSFSDVFSVEELHFDQSTSDVTRSCPLPYVGRTETELDMNLDRLIHDQRMRLPSEDLPKSAHSNHRLSVSFDAQCEGNNKEDLMSLTRSTTSNGLSRRSSHLSNSTAREPSLARQFSLSIGRLSRSLSFKEGSTLPELGHASIRSGPTQALNIHDTAADDLVNATRGGIRIGRFRKLLDPIFKLKSAKPVDHVDSYLPFMDNIGIKGMKDAKPVVQAVLQLTVKSGLPLFKFLVETNSEFLASTVKRLSPVRKDDPSWLYSFYSVEEVKRKSGGWRYQGNKGKSSDVSHNVIGQMKVSESMFCGNADSLEENFTRESVLYGIDLSIKGEGSSTSATAAKRELGAIVVKNPKEVSGDDQRNIMMPGNIVVIMPGAIHSLPSEGVPASLINRWRSGGLCDCGGWDVGCKLQVLTNQDEDDKLLRSSSGGYPLQHLCNLFLEGAETEKRPTFRLMGHGGGIYLVEYDPTISSLQAFAICVAVLTHKKEASLSGADGYSGGRRRGHYRSKSCIVEGEGTRYPPHSPVSRA